jgi:drug/metabolite transporter (DMT)-like permease
MRFPTSALVLLASIAVLWGINWPMMKLAMNELGVWQFRAMCILAAVFWLSAYCLFRKFPFAVPREHWPRLLACALANTTAWNVLAAAGIARLPSGRAAVIAYSMPLWVVLLSRFLLKEEVSRSRWFAITLGMFGIALLLFDEIEILKRAPLGAVFMLLAGFIWAFGIVLTKNFPKSVPTGVLVFWQSLLGGVPILLGALLVFDGKWLPSSAGAWTGLLFNLTIVFGYCHLAWNEIVRTLPANVTGITSLSVPVIGVLSGMAMLGETPRALDWTALGLLVLAVAIVLYGARTRPNS